MLADVQEKCEYSSAPVRELRQLPVSTLKDRERLLPLVAEPVAEGSPVLIFCSSRAQTQSTAAMIAEALPALLPQPTSDETAAKRRALVEQLRAATQDFSDPALEMLLSAGAVRRMSVCCDCAALARKGADAQLCAQASRTTTRECRRKRGRPSRKGTAAEKSGY